MLDKTVFSTLKSMMGEVFPMLVDQYKTLAQNTIEALQQAIDAGDAVAAREAAHSFKSSSAQIGAMVLSELCREMEVAAEGGNMSSIPANLEKLKQEWQLVEAELAEEA